MKLWNLLVEINEAILQNISSPEFISVSIDPKGYSFRIDQVVSSQNLHISFEDHPVECDRSFYCLAPLEVFSRHKKEADSPEWHLFRNYLPYALLPVFSMQMERCFAISHFAQTLDGRISTPTGISKWIGNHENLVHAHRMRALCDGILVGSETVRRDKPQLNVRHVTGSDPVKVLVGDLGNADIAHMNGSSIIVNDLPVIDGLNGSARQVRIKRKDAVIDTKSILDELYRSEIHSVYIEGGSFTTSTFLKHKAIDEVQIHMSPKIMGSGLTGFNFNGVSDVKNAITFDRYHYIKIGEEIMFVGTPIFS